MDREVIKKINKQTSILVPVLAALSYIIWQNEIVVFNIALGGFISWLNLRELAWAIKIFWETHVPAYSNRIELS